jgi:hypothetical protein
MVTAGGDSGWRGAECAWCPAPPSSYQLTPSILPRSLAHISTSYVERQNLTMRMAIRRFTRLTNAFSKKLVNLKAAVALHLAYYNFCRVHQTLRVTPAMEAGLADHVWTIAELPFSGIELPVA